MNCKKNIQPLPDVLGLKFINALQPVTFNWTTEPVGTPHYGDTHIGLIAEDVCTAIANTGWTAPVGSSGTGLYLYQESETVIDNDGITKVIPAGMCITDLIPCLISSIQTLSSQVTALQSEVSSLQTQLNKLQQV